MTYVSTGVPITYTSCHKRNWVVYHFLGINNLFLQIWRNKTFMPEKWQTRFFYGMKYTSEWIIWGPSPPVNVISWRIFFRIVWLNMMENSPFSKVKTACKLNIILLIVILDIHGHVITSHEAEGKQNPFIVKLEIIKNLLSILIKF